MLDKRRQIGVDWRHQVPVAAQSAWQSPANRRDPVEILIEQGKTRIPELLPVRYARMKTDPFAFLRGGDDHGRRSRLGIGHRFARAVMR